LFFRERDHKGSGSGAETLLTRSKQLFVPKEQHALPRNLRKIHGQNLIEKRLTAINRLGES
jgi:hypothetical protein